MDDQTKKLSELRDEMRQVSDIVWASEQNLEFKLGSEIRRNGMLLDRISDTLTIMESEISPQIMLLHSSVNLYGSAIVTNMRNHTVQMTYGLQQLKDAIVKGDANDITIARENERTAVEAPRVQETPIAGMNAQSVISRDLEKKIGLLCDSAADFLKSWSSPTEVGVALAIPIVGGLAVVLYGLYKIVGKGIDALVDVSHSIRDVASGGVKGLIFGNKPSSQQTTARQEADPQILGMQKDLRAASNTLSRIASGETEIVRAVREVKSAVAGIRIGSDNEALIKAVEAGADSIRASIDRLKIPAADLSKIKIETNPDFQKKVVEILSSTMKVQIMNQRSSDGARRETDMDAFSAAVRPLVAGQDALVKMLDSNMRRLTEAVAMLRETPAANDMSRVTSSNDTINSELSDTTVKLILDEAVKMRVALEAIGKEFGTFTVEWRSRTPKEQSREELPAVTSGD